MSRPAIAVRRARGRPKDPDKRAAILVAAKKLFLRHGLDGVSMDAIAREAGVSKLTLYSHFRAKDELFQTAVVEKCQEHTPTDLFDPLADRPLRERLTRIGRGFVSLIMSDDSMELNRMMASEAPGRSRLSRLFYAAGPQRMMDRFAALLAAADAAGELKVPDPSRAAAHFFCLLKGIHHFRAMLGVAPRASVRVLNTHVDEVVELFLRAYRPEH
jgi:TetR/AcrR family transcriptional repressor of mexJK operon